MAKKKATPSAPRQSLVAKLLVDLAPQLEGWGMPMAMGVGWDGSLYLVARRGEEERRTPKGAPKRRYETPCDYLVLRWHEGEVRTVIHRNESLVVSYVQPLAGGILLVGARCAWRSSGAETNALAIDWDDRQVGRFTLGDGIEDVRVTSDDTIWVSYFDEGVFGNYGWAHPGPAPIGSPGVVAFSSGGQVIQSYDAEAAGTDTICDAYAMNVAGDRDVWLYFYTEFSIVRMVGTKYLVWKLGLSGARGLAVQGDRVLLLGSYDHRHHGRIVELGGDGRARAKDQVEVVDEQGKALDSARCCGVGGSLYFFRGAEVLLLDGW